MHECFLTLHGLTCDLSSVLPARVNDLEKVLVPILLICGISAVVLGMLWMALIQRCGNLVFFIDVQKETLSLD